MTAASGTSQASRASVGSSWHAKPMPSSEAVPGAVEAQQRHAHQPDVGGGDFLRRHVHGFRDAIPVRVQRVAPAVAREAQPLVGLHHRQAELPVRVAIVGEQQAQVDLLAHGPVQRDARRGAQQRGFAEVPADRLRGARAPGRAERGARIAALAPDRAACGHGRPPADARAIEASRARKRDSPALPLPVSPLNPAVQGGGLSDASGFPAGGHAHSVGGEAPRQVLIGSRTNGLANSPGNRRGVYQRAPGPGRTKIYISIWR